MSWTVILPVKRLWAAKSRLRGAVPRVDHEALVLAMAMDTVSAALASSVVGRVVVVTTDQAVGESALALGADLIQDVPDAGLNPALAYAATLVRPKGATASLPGVAALPADLPALRTEDLTAALRAAEEVAWSTAKATFSPEPVRAFVPDAAGTGTVLLAAPPGARLEPCFGAGSAAAHITSGAVQLTGNWPGLRRDVDTAADLAEAVVLGVGIRTGAVRVSDRSTAEDFFAHGSTLDGGRDGATLESSTRDGAPRVLKGQPDTDTTGSTLIGPGATGG